MGKNEGRRDQELYLEMASLRWLLNIQEKNIYFDINTIKMDKNTKEMSIDLEGEGYKN